MAERGIPRISPARRAEIGLERRNRTRDRLIRAALTVVAEQGFDLPVIDDFIQAADVSRGTFYNYFKTKDELVLALCERINADRIRYHDQIRAGVDDLAERLVVGVRLILRDAQLHPSWGRIYAQTRVLQTAGRRAENRGPKRDLLAAMEAGRLRQQPIDFALDMFYAMLHQGMMRAIGRLGPDDLDQRVATCILAGLGMPFDEAWEIAGRPLPPDLGMTQETPEVRQAKRRRRAPSRV